MSRFDRAALAAGAFALGALFDVSAARGAAMGGSPFDNVAAGQMRDMTAAMARAPMSGDPDRDFVAMMTPHHRGAIAMAEAELTYGRDAVLRRLAQEIVVTQQSEIQAMALRLRERHELAAGDAAAAR